MAQASYAESLLGGIDRDLRRALRAVLDYVLANLRIGRPIVGKREGNLQLYAIEGTTASVANEEFSIEHSLNTPPYLALQVLSLQSEGSRMVRLTVTRVADSRRVYLSSPDTDAPVTLLIEG